MITEYPYLKLSCVSLFIFAGCVLPLSVCADEEETTELDELVIVQQKKLVESDGATLSYNVSEDPEAGSSNILDILRKVPGVSIDAEDNIRVNNSSSFKILLNGHEDPMLKGDLKTVLKSFPAASIKKIEVISEPGAKYEAEGVGGILNIITDRSKNLAGFLAQAGIWVNGYQAGGYVNGRTKLRNVMLDANVSYNNGRVWPRTSESQRTTEYLNDSDQTLQSVKTTSKGEWDYTGVNLNMSWEPDTLNLFTLAMNYWYNSWGSNSFEERDMKNRYSSIWSLQRNSFSDGTHNGIGLIASFQHNFHRDDHNLVFSYEYDYGKSKYSTIYRLLQQEGAVDETPYSAAIADAPNYIHIFQLDYKNRFSSKHLLEAGGKLNINSDRSLNSQRWGKDDEEALVNAAQTVESQRIRDIYALYASYTGSFDKWSVKGGLRNEYSRLGMKYRIGDFSDFISHFNDLVPNAAVSYNLSSASALRLAYQMRISRPGIEQMNPFVNTLTPGAISYGNPDLKTEKGHTFSLGYTNYEHPFTGGAKLTYRYVNNAVNDVIFLRDGVVHYTYANVGKRQTLMCDLNFDWSIINNLKWGAYFSVSYTDMRADSEMLTAKNSGWQTSINTNLNYTLPSGMRLSGYGGYYTPWIDLQGRGTSDGYYYGLGLSRSWLKNDAITLQVSASNFLPAKRSNSYIQQDESLKYSYRGRYSQWSVGMSITFKIGGLTAAVKKTAADIEKESSGGGNSKGGN